MMHLPNEFTMDGHTVRYDLDVRRGDKLGFPRRVHALIGKSPCRYLARFIVSPRGTGAGTALMTAQVAAWDHEGAWVYLVITPEVEEGDAAESDSGDVLEKLDAILADASGPDGIEIARRMISFYERFDFEQGDDEDHMFRRPASTRPRPAPASP